MVTCCSAMKAHIQVRVTLNLLLCSNHIAELAINSVILLAKIRAGLLENKNRCYVHCKSQGLYEN